MWKLVKLTRLIRILKIVKKKNMNLAHKATKALKLDSALERLFFFLFGAFFVIHILSCLWVFFCVFAENEPETFVDDSFKNMEVADRYLTSLYFIITTFSTVGYGDISAVTNSEKIMSVFAELLGGMIFGMLVGTLSSIITQGRMAEQLCKKNPSNFSAT